MKWRWIILDYIPPELEVPRDQHRALRREVISSRGMYRTPRGKLLFLSGLGFALVFIFVLDTIIDYFTRLGLPYPRLVFIALGLAGLYTMSAVVWRSLYESKTYHLLATYGYEICGTCGYLLKELPEGIDTCPECGTPRTGQPNSRLVKQT